MDMEHRRLDHRTNQRLEKISAEGRLKRVGSPGVGGHTCHGNQANQWLAEPHFFG